MSYYLVIYSVKAGSSITIQRMPANSVEEAITLFREKFGEDCRIHGVLDEGARRYLR